MIDFENIKKVIYENVKKKKNHIENPKKKSVTSSP